MFGQKLKAKLEYEYTYNKPLNYFEGVPRVARPKIVKRNTSEEKSKQEKIKYYVEQQEERGYYMKDEKEIIEIAIEKREKKEKAEAEKLRKG